MNNCKNNSTLRVAHTLSLEYFYNISAPNVYKTSFTKIDIFKNILLNMELRPLVT